MKHEMVLAVKRALLDEIGMFQGLNFEPGRYLPAILARENNRFIPRAEAENDPTFKQIIPYVLLTHGGRVLHYTRGKKAGEQRLVSRGSIGIGGHMNDGDEGLFALDEAAYLAGVRREVREELWVETEFEDRAVALLNDDSNAVGQVHLGVVHVFRLENASVRKREAMIVAPEFLTVEELRARRENLESSVADLRGRAPALQSLRLQRPGKEQTKWSGFRCSRFVVLLNGRLPAGFDVQVVLPPLAAADPLRVRYRADKRALLIRACAEGSASRWRQWRNENDLESTSQRQCLPERESLPADRAPPQVLLGLPCSPSRRVEWRCNWIRNQPCGGRDRLDGLTGSNFTAGSVVTGETVGESCR